MKKTAIFAITFLVLFGMAAPAVHAYWVWSPDIGKWVNPKKSAKDTPEEQYQWALDFYNKKEWDRAIDEFQKLPAAFPTSRLAAEGVYYAGLCWEEKKDLAKAADAYQTLIDHYPYSDRIKDAIKREFEIANQFAEGEKVKVLGVPAIPGGLKALDLYTHVVKNAPFGSYGDQAQFKIGELYKQQGEYEEAQKAFQTVVDEYPNSDLVAKARFEIAQCSMLASKKSQYNEQYADRAIEEFKGFKENFPNQAEALVADESIKSLRAKKAMTNLETGAFYEKQKRWASAKVYYGDVIRNYPEAPAAETARKRLAEIEKQETQPAGGFKLPSIGVPKIGLPKISLPSIGMPKLPWAGKKEAAEGKTQ